MPTGNDDTATSSEDTPKGADGEMGEDAVVWTRENIYEMMRNRSRDQNFRFVGRDIVITERNVGDMTAIGTKLWTTAEVFSQYLESGIFPLQDKKVIELGSGTGLVGIVTSLLGADVTLTDLPDIIYNLEPNVAINTRGVKHPPTVCPLAWGVDLHSFPKAAHYDYVIGSDLVYDADVFEGLIQTIKYLSDGDTTILLGFHLRVPDRDLKFLNMFTNEFKVVKEHELPNQGKAVRLYEARTK
ncbi:protein N-lysine methyltransferase METTL21A-like [Branchiostoma floridae x Branchiostoma belcheri]